MIATIVELFFSKVAEKVVDFAQDMSEKINLATLKRNLNALLAKASDVEDKIKSAELSGKKKRKREVEDWLKQVEVIKAGFLELENQVESQGLISRFIGRFVSGDEAANMNARVNQLVEQSRHFGDQLVLHDVSRSTLLLTTGLLGGSFEVYLETVMDLLVLHKVSSIGIYGMGGVGKTHLVKHIHNQLLGGLTHQDCVVWVTASQVFSINRLQDDIAKLVGLNFEGECDEDKRAAKLNEALSLRSSTVLILDDVWRNINLQKVGDPLSVEGCRLIITTRSLQVCRQIGCQEIVEVQTLDIDEAWELFRGTLGQETVLGPQVEEIAKSMAKMCDGLPLGIITLAGSMRGETGIHVWRNELAELRKSVMGQDDMKDQVFKVLKYSFDRLDPCQQRCFLYCSLYPEDATIQREALIRKYVSEELLDRRKSIKAQFDKGHSILNKLVNVCLLESGTHGDSVKMHDLIRAMALEIMEGTALVIAGYHSLKEIPSEEDWNEDLEKVSLMCNGIEEVPSAMSPNCPHLITLLLHDNLSLGFLPCSFFSRMQALCSLDLSRTDILELPDSLSDLESLKSLRLGECRKLVYIPDLGKLKALVELDLSNSAIEQVPQGMHHLVSLKYLSMNGAYCLKIFPRGIICNYPNLRLLILPYQIETPLEEIQRLKHLEELKGPLENVCDFGGFIRNNNTFHDIQVGSTYATHRNHMVLNMSSEQDMMLIFDQCKSLSNCLADDFSQVDHPSSLKNLRVSNSKSIECLHFMAPKQESKFSGLEKILLRELPDFMGLILKQETRSQAHAFSCLKYLTICKCNKMRKLGLPASEIPNLEIICVQWCEQVEEILEAEALVHLPRLKQMYMIQLPKLRSICNATMVCNSMTTLHLEQCTSLKKLPLYFPSSTQNHCSHPPALEEIWIVEEEKEWWESLEWDHPTHYHLIQPFLHFWG